jgi:acyl-CoA dehydrogenase
MAERALELAIRRARSRIAFGGPLTHQGVIQAQLAESRLEIDQARMLVLRAAWLVDTVGGAKARSEVAAIKVVGPRMAQSVLDRAIQIHGGMGVSEDTPLARMWATARLLRIADGPDEVHLRTIAREEMNKYA